MVWGVAGKAGAAALPWAGRSLWQLLRQPFLGARPGGAAAGYRTTLGTFPKATPAGYFNFPAHKLRTSAYGLGAAGGTAATLPWLLRDEEEQMSPPIGMAPGPQEWSPPYGLPTATERAQSSRSEYLAGMQDIIARSGIISTIDKKAGQKYRENMFDILTTTSAYSKNVELAKISDAALSKEGTPREIYHRMIKAGATAEEAAVASGHQVDIVRAEQTSMGAKAQVWDSIMQTLMAGNVDSAALMLVQAWGTGQLGGAPITENFEQRLETARLYLTGIMEGETAATAPGAGSGITDISLS